MEFQIIFNVDSAVRLSTSFFIETISFRFSRPWTYHSCQGQIFSVHPPIKRSTPSPFIPITMALDHWTLCHEFYRWRSYSSIPFRSFSVSIFLCISLLFFKVLGSLSAVTISSAVTCHVFIRFIFKLISIFGEHASWENDVSVN